jgi:hypothetical protein
MDLISSIKFLEGRLGGRKPDYGKKKSAQKNARNNTTNEKIVRAETNYFSTEYDTRLGRKLNTTA